MINLLPPEEKAKLQLQKNKKLTMVLGITLTVPLVCLVLVLLSIHFYLLGEINSEKVALDQTRKDLQTPDFLTFSNIIGQSNATLQQLEQFYQKEAYMSAIVKAITSVSIPQSIYLTDLSVQKTDKGPMKGTASGFSGSREDLLVFQKNLEATAQIKNLNFSPESWISPKNSTFHVSFEINPMP